jgi:hypothetical protein
MGDETMSYTSPILKLAGVSFDANFEKEAEFQNAPWMCAALPIPDDLLAGPIQALPIYESSNPVYPREQWKDLIQERDADDGAGWIYRRIRRMHNQKKEGTCVYNMLSLMKEMVWNRQFGDRFWIPFSPVSGYRWNAPGPKTGSNIGQCIVWDENNGLLPEDTAENKALMQLGYFHHVHPAVGYSARFMPGWEETAKLFRAMPQEKGGWYRVTTVEGWFSSLFDGNANGGGRSRHAIAHCGAAMDGNSYFSIFGNSWDTGGPSNPGWGTALMTAGGSIRMFGFDGEDSVRTMVSRGGFVLVNMRRPTFLDLWMAAMAA